MNVTRSQENVSVPSLGPAFCLAEDRTVCETGLRLAILSLSRHCANVPVYVYRHHPTPAFTQWAERFTQVTLIPERPVGAESWNCKPHALLPIIARGHSAAIWLDSDIILTRDCSSLLFPLEPEIFVITQEPASLPSQGTESRTLGWNLEVGRRLPITLNSSVLRVTQKHVSLLEQWRALLNDSTYIRVQQLALEERPLHMMSDQDVLNGLLGCRDFSSVPLKILRSGDDIIHCGGALGYSLHERARGVFRRVPTFLHATAGKPWLWLGGQPEWSQRTFFSWHRRLLQETSPYLAEAKKYESQLEEDASWLRTRTGIGVALTLLGLGNVALRGLPLTIAATAIRSIR